MTSLNPALSRSREQMIPMESLPGLIALTAVIEFLGLRLLIRMGPMLPQAARGDTAAAITEGLILLGTIAQNLALFLLPVVLAVIAWRTVHTGLKASLALLLTLFVGHTLVGPALPSWLYAAFLVAAFATMTAALWTVNCPCQRPFWLAIFAAAYLFILYPTLAATLALPLPFVPVAHALAELLAVLAACLAPLALRPRFERRALLLAGTAVVLVTGMWFSVAWLPPTLMIWTVAFTGYLPAPVYILALGLFLYTLVALTLNGGAHRNRVPTAVLALLLIALGGLRWDVGYYTLLGLFGFLTLSGVVRFEPESSPSNC
jgi:hypothetical protein